MGKHRQPGFVRFADVATTIKTSPCRRCPPIEYDVISKLAIIVPVAAMASTRCFMMSPIEPLGIGRLDLSGWFDAPHSKGPRNQMDRAVFRDRQMCADVLA